MQLPHLGLVMAAIAKNEGPFVAEWVAYHYALGVEHLVIYDNGSTDGTAATLAPFINSGIVTLIDWPLYPGQIEAYQHALATFGPRCDWMGFLDIDEFVALPEGQSLPGFLRRIPPDDDALVLFWRMFGHSGHRTRPDALMIEAFVRCDPQLWQISKCFVRPDRVRQMHVHHADTVNRRSVDDQGRPLRQVWMHERDAVSGDHAVVHHYFTRSYDDYRAKIGRGQADGRSEKKLEPFEKWDYAHRDDRLARHAPAVREVLELARARGARPLRYGNMTAMGAVGSSRNFVVASQAAIRAEKDALEAGGTSAVMQHSVFGTALVLPDARPDDDEDAMRAVERLCAQLPAREELRLPARPHLGPLGLARPRDLCGSVWVAAAFDVRARGRAEFVMNGILRGGDACEQRRVQPLPDPGLVLVLALVNDRPFVPLDLRVETSDPEAVRQIAVRAFAAD